MSRPELTRYAKTYYEPPDPSEEFVLLAIKGRRIPSENKRTLKLYQQIGDEAAWQVAQDNKVVPMVAHALLDLAGEVSVPDHWKAAHEEAYRRISRVLVELDHISCLLAAQDVPIVLIEHGAIARTVYACRGCFSAKDLDTLVLESHAPTVHKVLLAEGYMPTSRRLAAPTRQEYNKELEPGLIFWLNVQWRPLMRIWTPAVERLSTAELLDRSQLVGDPNSCVRILSPEDNLLLCALHTSIHGYVRPPGIRLHLDVDRIVHLVPINWDVFLQRVFALKCRHRVYLSLAIPKVLLGTPIPEEVLFTLVPSSKKCRNMLDWVAQNGFFEDDRPKFSRADFVRLELMLYDDGLLRGLAQVIFPPPAWMKQRYQTSNDWFLAYLYAKRLVAIALKWVP